MSLSSTPHTPVAIADANVALLLVLTCSNSRPSFVILPARLTRLFLNTWLDSFAPPPPSWAWASAGLGWRVYVADRFNIFDAVIVIVSLVELVSGGGGGIVSVFRAFRLMRVLKLAKSFTSLRILLATVGESISNVSYMTAILFLFVFMFAVLGVQGPSQTQHTRHRL